MQQRNGDDLPKLLVERIGRKSSPATGKLPTGLVVRPKCAAGTNGGKQMPSTDDNTGKGYVQVLITPYIRPIRGRRSAGLTEFSACYRLLAVPRVGWVRPLISQWTPTFELGRQGRSRPRRRPQPSGTFVHAGVCNAFHWRSPVYNNTGSKIYLKSTFKPIQD